MKDTIIEAEGDRRYCDPVVCLLMWAVALKGEPARALLSVLGVEQAELAGMFEGLEEELAAMRRLRTVGELFGRELLGKLLIAKLAELTMRAESGRELEPLIRAAGRVPDWAFGETQAQEGRAYRRRDQGAGLSLADIEALTPTGNGNGAGEGDAADDVPDDIPFDQALSEVRELLGELDRLGTAEAELREHRQAPDDGGDGIGHLADDGDEALGAGS